MEGGQQLARLAATLPLLSATATATAARFARQATEVASWQREFNLSVNLHLIELSLCVCVCQLHSFR